MMRELIIVTRDINEYGKNLWGFEEIPNKLQFAKFSINNYSIILIKQAQNSPIEGHIEMYSQIILNNISLYDQIDQYGIIFHKLNGNSEAAVLRAKLETALNGKLAFCEWYSSLKTDFWREQNANAELPYNKLKKAWKGSNGDKEKTFEAVWEYFLGDKEEETLTEAIFTAIYEQRNEEAIENAISFRDKYIKEKGRF